MVFLSGRPPLIGPSTSIVLYLNIMLRTGFGRQSHQNLLAVQFEVAVALAALVAAELLGHHSADVAGLVALVVLVDIAAVVTADIAVGLVA